MFRGLSRSARIVLVVLLVLLTIRLLLPVAGYYGINWALQNKLGNYTGRIDDFDLSLYRGAYQLQDLKVTRKDAPKESSPLLFISEIDLSLSWTALFQGTLAADILILDPRIRLTDSQMPEQTQLAVDEPTENWQAFFDQLIPVKIESFAVENGSVFFTNQDLQPLVPVKAEDIFFNLIDVYTRDRETPSPFSLHAKLQEHADLDATGEVDFLSEVPKWDVDFKFQDFELSTINDTLRAYVPIDFTRSVLSVYGEAMSKKPSSLQGYVKVFLNETDVIRSEQKFVGLDHIFIELIAAFGNWILENEESGKVATLIPFEMNSGKWDVDSSKAFWSAVENKEDQLQPKIDKRLTLDGFIEP